MSDCAIVTGIRWFSYGLRPDGGNPSVQLTWQLRCEHDLRTPSLYVVTAIGFNSALHNSKAYE